MYVLCLLPLVLALLACLSAVLRVVPQITVPGVAWIAARRADQPTFPSTYFRPNRFSMPFFSIEFAVQ